jgi:hypothetical protein
MAFSYTSHLCFFFSFLVCGIGGEGVGMIDAISIDFIP